MIINLKNQADKWYTELARIISTLQVKGRLRPDEARCLLDIIDLVVVQKNLELFRLLEEYIERDGIPETHEIEEIVKATLIGTNLKQQENMEQLTAVIGELIRERNRILDQQQEDDNGYMA
ncbi:MAG: hypothetical protein ACM3UW_09395 [Bacillota bacterium]